MVSLVLTMRVVIDWRKYGRRLEDIVDLVEKHAKSADLDEDKGILVIEDPDGFLLDELKGRGIEFEAR
jgi:hypothetical protein